MWPSRILIPPNIQPQMHSSNTTMIRFSAPSFCFYIYIPQPTSFSLRFSDQHFRPTDLFAGSLSAEGGRSRHGTVCQACTIVDHHPCNCFRFIHKHILASESTSLSPNAGCAIPRRFASGMTESYGKSSLQAQCLVRVFEGSQKGVC